MLSTLPAELQNEVVLHIAQFENATDRTSTLSALALCDRTFAKICREPLYRNISIEPGTRQQPSPRLYRLLRTLLLDDQSIGAKVQSLSTSIVTTNWLKDENTPYLDLPLAAQLLKQSLSKPVAECFRRGLFQGSSDFWEALVCVLLVLLPNLESCTVRLGPYTNGKNLFCRVRGHSPPLIFQKLRHLEIRLPDRWHVGISPAPFPLLQVENVTPLQSLTIDGRGSYHPRDEFRLFVGARGNQIEINLHSLTIIESHRFDQWAYFLHPIKGIRNFAFEIYDVKSIEGVLESFSNFTDTLERASIVAFLPDSFVSSDRVPNNETDEEDDLPVRAAQALQALPSIIERAITLFGRDLATMGSFQPFKKLKTLLISELLLLGSQPVTPTLASILPESLEELILQVPRRTKVFEVRRPGQPEIYSHARLIEAMEDLPSGLKSIRFVCKISDVWYTSPPIEINTFHDREAIEVISIWRPFLEWKVRKCPLMMESQRIQMIQKRHDKKEGFEPMFHEYKRFAESYEKTFGEVCHAPVRRFVQT
ncbi:hypothetical protein BU24DRAFT_422616 [Aaosphaeria arxii CBS 175.79]|uniref:Uncharacterized protein n=1 Tax=Aaosphaeria arxii CBS 175.79 TaxID=1450172 RepID=A0A6A5XSJ9_9PLEO|nr:uncharacterized protein BU24DRAFT_422616 [Aaosphaeria arxii CBS 175.79]KAF2016278.1 hypothetical protein BU24DRAFT_422616 [Aaosphaeria arxii CBS 175.79]